MIYTIVQCTKVQELRGIYAVQGNLLTLGILLSQANLLT